jgi:hypothetical protein
MRTNGELWIKCGVTRQTSQVTRHRSVGFPTISNSAAVISKLLQVFMSRGVKWKFVNGSYVRCLLEDEGGGRGGLKFAVFLFKKKEGGVLVTDFMLVSGWIVVLMMI